MHKDMQGMLMQIRQEQDLPYTLLLELSSQYYMDLSWNLNMTHAHTKEKKIEYPQYLVYIT